MGIGMRYDDIVKAAHEALENAEYEDAQVLAMLAVADRLDRLCALQAGGADRRL